jgi:hypothetical protein
VGIRLARVHNAATAISAKTFITYTSAFQTVVSGRSPAGTGRNLGIIIFFQ